MTLGTPFRASPELPFFGPGLAAKPTVLILSLYSIWPMSLTRSIFRAGFIVVDVVLAFLVAAFVISSLVAWLRSLFLRTFTKRKAALLLDCLTCAVMILSQSLLPVISSP